MNICIVSLHVESNKKIATDLLKKTFDNWRYFSKKYGYDIKFFDELISKEKRAHPAWQKLLVFRKLKQYDAVCWVDTDIIFTKQAPNFECEKIKEVVESKKILAVKEPAIVSKNETIDYSKFYMMTLGRCPKTINLFNSGLFIASPKQMGDELESVYWNGDECKSHYEMPALNELIFNQDNAFIEMENKFNRLYTPLKSMNFLKGCLINIKMYNKMKYWKYEMSLYPNASYLKKLVKDSYGIHFCGGKQLAQSKALEIISNA